MPVPWAMMRCLVATQEAKCPACAKRARKLRQQQIREGWHRDDEPDPGRALGLRWDDVDLEVGVLRVRRSLHRVEGQLATFPTKTQRSARAVPLPGMVVRALRDHQRDQEAERLALEAKWPSLGYVFTTPIGTPLDPRNCTRLVQDQCAAAGLPAIRLHDLRHGCVSVLLALGVPRRTVMDIVGHSTLEMTMTSTGM